MTPHLSGLYATASLFKHPYETEKSKHKEVSLENIPWSDQLYDKILPRSPDDKRHPLAINRPKTARGPALNYLV